MSDRPAAAAVFDDLITALTEIRDGYVLDERRWTDPTEIAEAFRYVGPGALGLIGAVLGRATPTIHASCPSSRPPANCGATIRMRSTTSPRSAATAPTACLAGSASSAVPRSPSTGRPRTAGITGRFSATETMRFHHRRRRHVRDHLQRNTHDGDWVEAASRRTFDRRSHVLRTVDIGAERRLDPCRPRYPGRRSSAATTARRRNDRRPHGGRSRLPSASHAGAGRAVG